VIDGVVGRTKGGDTLTGCPSRGGGRLLGRSGAAIHRLTSMRVGHGRHGGREKYGDGRRRRGKGFFFPFTCILRLIASFGSNESR
jgi:hypothetical protein